MNSAFSFDEAVAFLKDLYSRSRAGEPGVAELTEIISARDEVVPRYQQLFASEQLSKLTAEDFRAFLVFKNNQHWMSLQRMGPAICTDMDRLRKALGILLDEERRIEARLNELVPTSGSAFVPRLSKAVLTPILLIAYPDRYGVWNQVSESAMKALGLWPNFERGMPFGDRYLKVNAIMKEVEAAVGVDLWTLDALWWRAEDALREDGDVVDPAADETIPPEIESEGSRFGLERHLQEFMRDNWDHIDLGSEWKIYEEDGDPEAGFEYPCGIGRIDLLARHRTEPRWLVIELKRRQSSDQTVGQVLRYMGWVQEQMAEPGDAVEGLVVAHDGDESIRYALKVVPNVRLKLYEVKFQLREPTPT